MADCRLKLLWNIGVQFDVRSVTPEQVGREGQIALARPIIAFAANAFIYAEDFLNDDNRPARRAAGSSDIGVELRIALKGRNWRK